jgi:hypothetical protein
MPRMNMASHGIRRQEDIEVFDHPDGLEHLFSLMNLQVGSGG